MGREFELKYRASDAVLQQIQEEFGDFSSISMETAYYDTPSRDLGSRRWMLRRRLENGVSVCTLKTPLPDGSRGEWEAVAETIEEGIPALLAACAPAKLEELTKSGLINTCAARFTRLAAVLELEGCTLELALDRGAFLADSREAPFCELEVELKSGSEAAARTYANALAERFHLEPEIKSKAQRARELADTL